MTTGDYSQEFYQLYDDLDIPTFIKLLNRLQYSSVHSLDNTVHMPKMMLCHNTICTADDQLECVERDNEVVTSYTVKIEARQYNTMTKGKVSRKHSDALAYTTTGLE